MFSQYQSRSLSSQWVDADGLPYSSQPPRSEPSSPIFDRLPSADRWKTFWLPSSQDGRQGSPSTRQQPNPYLVIPSFHTRSTSPSLSSSSRSTIPYHTRPILPLHYSAAPGKFIAAPVHSSASPGEFTAASVVSAVNKEPRILPPRAAREKALCGIDLVKKTPKAK